MSIDQGTQKLAIVALIVALLLAPISLYAAMQIGNLAQQQTQSARDLGSKIDRLSRQINETSAQTGQVVQALQEKILRLEQNLTALQSELRNLSTANSQLREALAANVTSIAEQISTLQAQLSLLQQGLKATNQSIAAALENVNQTLNSLYSQLKSLQESALMLFPVTVVDATGDPVLIPQRPERIVSLAPSVTEALYFVNATSRIVGVDSYSNWPPQVVEGVNNGSIAVIGGFWTPDIEKILSLQPDLVVGVDNVPSHEQVKEILKAYGIPVILLPQSSVDDIKESLIMLGKATGNIADAARSAAEFESRVMRIRLAGQSVQNPLRVALIVWLGNPTYVVGNGTFQGSGINLIGAVNAFGYLQGWPAISPEELVNASPDVIILVNINLSDFYNYINETLGSDAQNIPAVANNRVYSLMGNLEDLINRPSPRFALGLLLLQYIVYPEIYGYNVTSVPHTITQIPENLTFPEPTIPPS